MIAQVVVLNNLPNFKVIDLDRETVYDQSVFDQILFRDFKVEENWILCWETWKVSITHFPADLKTIHIMYDQLAHIMR